MLISIEASIVSKKISHRCVELVAELSLMRMGELESEAELSKLRFEPQVRFQSQVVHLFKQISSNRARCSSGLLLAIGTCTIGYPGGSLRKDEYAAHLDVQGRWRSVYRA